MKSKGNSHTNNSTPNVQNKAPTGGGGGGGGASTRGNDNKPQPTAEQIRYAKLSQLTGQEDHKIQEKIKQVADITGKSPDTVAMALHELNYDECTAIQKLIDGDYDMGVEWTTTASKKKKQPVVPVVTKTPNEPTPETGPTVNDTIEEPDQKPAGKLPSRGGRVNRRGRSRKPDEKTEDRLIENEDDIDREKGRSMSEKGRGRGKMPNRTQSRGRGRSAGYGGKGNFGRGGSRSRGRQPRRGRGRGGFGSIERDNSTYKSGSGNDAFDIVAQENWDEEEDTKRKSNNWGDMSDSSPEQTTRSKGDWGDQPGNQVNSLFYTSGNTSKLAGDSWKHANGPEIGWLESESEPKSEDSSYLPENVDDAVILSKRASHTTKSEATSYHSTSEMSRVAYATLQNNQFPSSNPETSLTSGLPNQPYQIESLLNPPLASSDNKDFSSVPVISGIQDSRKLEQEQLQGQKTQKTQKAKRPAKPQLPCQPVEMPRSMMHELDKQLSGLQFGSSPLSSNLSQESTHALSTVTTAAVFTQSQTTNIMSSTTQDTSRQPVVPASPKPVSAPYKVAEDYGSHVSDPPRPEVKSEIPEVQRPKLQKPETRHEGQHDMRDSLLLRQEETRKEVTVAEFPHAKTTIAETPRFNGVNDIREAAFPQAVDTEPLTLSVQDIRRQSENTRGNLDASQAAAMSELQKAISQRGDVPTDRINMNVGSMTSYMPGVTRHRKPQEVTKPYSAPETVRHNVLNDPTRYVPRAEVHKQSPPLTTHDPVRQSLRSESTRSNIIPEMKHSLVQGQPRRSGVQEATRHDVVGDVPPMPVAHSKSDKPKTPPGLSSLQERNANVYSGSPSRDVTRLATTALAMVTSNQVSLNNNFGGVSRGNSMVYVSSSVSVPSTVQTSSVISNATPSGGLSGTNTFSSTALTTIGFTSGTSTQSGIKGHTASSKSSGPSGMVPLNLIPNVQQSMVTPAFPHQAIAAAPYPYDEMQMMQRMPISPFFEHVMYTPTAGTARENIPNAHTFQGNEGKYVRDNSSPVASSINQGTPHAPHAQAAIFAGTPTALPYGYAYLPPGVIPSGFPVFTTAPVFQMSPNKVHMASQQFPSGYGAQPSHASYSGGSQDFSKNTFHSSVGQSNPHKSNQGTVTLTSGTSATDSGSHHSSGYKMQLNQDTKTFVNGTPPSLGIPVPHGQNHLGNYPPHYMMQHASVLPSQHVGHHQLDSSNQNVHGGRAQPHLGISSSQHPKRDFKSQSLWPS